MRKWTAKTMDWYLRAAAFSQYPRLILGKILPQLKLQDSILDLGCGPGAYALALAPRVAKVFALDRDPEALACLAQQAKALGLDNIIPLKGVWPQTQVTRKIDAVICALGSGEIMTSAEGLRAILALGARQVFFVAPGSYLPPFGWEHHKNKPGASAETTMAVLTELEIPFSSEEFTLDFGQPVADLAEAGEFLADFLCLLPAQANSWAKAIALPHPQGLYLPNRRHLWLIHFGRS